MARGMGRVDDKPTDRRSFNFPEKMFIGSDV
jgi:hypothetical protein